MEDLEHGNTGIGESPPSMDPSDPNYDPNYKHHRLVAKIQRFLHTMPPGWKQNPKVGTKSGEAPYVHEDGRVSWKNPNADQINAILEAAREEEEKELQLQDLSNEEKASDEVQVQATTARNRRFLKKYRLMVKRGVPMEAVKQQARLVDGIDVDESDLLLAEMPKKSSDKGDSGSGSIGQKEQRKKGLPNQKLLKKYRLMVKSGVPIEAVKQQARLIDRVDVEESDLLDDSSNKEHGKDASAEDIDSALIVKESTDSSTSGKKVESNSSYEFFNPIEGHGQVEFVMNSKFVEKEESYLARLVQKMILTVNKAKSTFGNNTVRGGKSIVTASTKDLYNALGAFEGVQFARDRYNSTCGEKYHTMTEGEIKSKRKPFLELVHNLGVRRDPIQQQEKVDVKGLDELVLYIKEQFHDELEEIKNTINVGMYDFKSLAHIYKLASRVVGKSVFASGVDMICEVVWSRFEEGKTLFGTSRSFKVCFQFIVAVGKHYTMCEYVESIENFEGRRHIQSLSFISVARDAQSDSVKAAFRRRGEMYAQFAKGAKYMAYDRGSFFAKGGKSSSGTDGTSALQMSGRMMVDVQGSYEAGHSLGIGNDMMIAEIKQKYKEYMLLMRAQNKRAKGDDCGNTKFEDSAMVMVLFDTVPDDYLEMTWPALIGFSFTSKLWGEVLIDGLNDVQFNESAFDNLVLPKSRKRMVKALVRHSNTAFNDIVSGKGKGSCFLLYGPPGTGKTLTAEAVAELLHRPLYSVSLGQLGVSASDLETKLGEVLDLCSRWDALILLDEADIFLEKRSSNGSLERNAMVSVMLRLVEYFKGTLFLTSNRVDSLDPAFKTRITLALRYEQLDVAARKQIWSNLLKVSGFGAFVSNRDIKVEKLATHKLNGREIKNAIRLAMALAEEDQEPLSQKLILETIETLNDFNKKMMTAASY
eukprot:CAMPEP_0203666356 /NCGR_PEP_ID=MMETSP0090-20130426/3396_1 /ASSEMBLY_ACC=CAM_ASM_001088 /TAXON_ID=426623 /ORGANISM="Chaetoceros affinis, Strain CCMP159" /LENGTH=926 /DNA_ID=CAMNT_0050530207 /DNA_START=126 /DNA_END=2906 /DNA_ORIENTATION=-